MFSVCRTSSAAAWNPKPKKKGKCEKKGKCVFFFSPPMTLGFLSV
jgi:hypothetical protein